ncbi:MAG TPA: hypothetical protein V6C65_14525, partial [Allocoleopsis sp.]
GSHPLPAVFDGELFDAGAVVAECDAGGGDVAGVRQDVDAPAAFGEQCVVSEAEGRRLAARVTGDFYALCKSM